jgi:hypothetical protein
LSRESLARPKVTVNEYVPKNAASTVLRTSRSTKCGSVFRGHAFTAGGGGRVNPPYAYTVCPTKCASVSKVTLQPEEEAVGFKTRLYAYTACPTKCAFVLKVTLPPEVEAGGFKTRPYGYARDSAIKSFLTVQVVDHGLADQRDQIFDHVRH